MPGPNPEERASRPLNTRPFFRLSARQPWQIKLTDDDGKPLWPTLADRLDRVGRAVAGVVAPPAHRRIFFGARGRRRTPPTPARSSRGSPAGPIAARSVRRSWTAWWPYSSGPASLGDGFEASVKTALLAVLCSDSFLYLVEGSPAAASARSDRLGAGLAALVFPLELDARRSPDGPRRQGDAPRARDAPGRSPADDGRPEGGGLRRVVPPPVAPAPPRGDVRARPEALSRLRRISRKEHGRRDHRVLPRGARARPARSASSSTPTGRCSTRSSPATTGSPAWRGRRCAGWRWRRATIGAACSRRRRSWAYLRRHAAPPGPSREVGARVDLRQPAAAPAAERDGHQADAPEPAEDLAAGEDRGPPRRAQLPGCHRKIDPLGLAFEQYDAIGRFADRRGRPRRLRANPPIDAGGELPDGRKFADADGLKALMVDDLDRFARAFAGKLATYALRRGMTIDDRKAPGRDRRADRRTPGLRPGHAGRGPRAQRPLPETLDDPGDDERTRGP